MESPPSHPIPDILVFGSRADRHAVEEGLVFAPKFDEHGLIPAIATDAATGAVLMVAYMNEESLRETLRRGEAVYYSRSRKTLWHKGGSSGHAQVVREILVDCDQDALVLKVDQNGPGCCHVGYSGCFYRGVPFGADLPETTPDKPLPLHLTEVGKAYDPKAVYG